MKFIFIATIVLSATLCSAASARLLTPADMNDFVVSSVQEARRASASCDRLHGMTTEAYRTCFRDAVSSASTNWRQNNADIELSEQQAYVMSNTFEATLRNDVQDHPDYYVSSEINKIGYATANGALKGLAFAMLIALIAAGQRFYRRMRPA